MRIQLGHSQNLFSRWCKGSGFYSFSGIFQLLMIEYSGLIQNSYENQSPQGHPHVSQILYLLIMKCWIYKQLPSVVTEILKFGRNVRNSSQFVDQCEQT